jgi:hypothetical protein
MKFFPGDPVVLTDTRVSQAGGKPRTFSEESKGRVCKVHGSGFCCVQFSKGCLRVHEDFLSASTEPAPNCPDKCSAGC